MRKQTLYVRPYFRTGPHTRKCRACGESIDHHDAFIMEKVERDDGLEMWYLHDSDMCAGADRVDMIVETEARLEAET